MLVSSRPKDGGADADHCTAFFDGDEVVVGHAHGNLGTLARRAMGRLFEAMGRPLGYWTLARRAIGYGR